MQKPSILLIGCGPHAKRVYIPILKETEKEFGTQLKIVVEIKEKKDDVCQYLQNKFENVEFVFTNEFEKKYTHTLPRELENELNKLIIKHKINGVIIATDPLHHMQYALWALKNNLNILMDKPISTYDNISNSISQSKQLIKDYEIIMENYNMEKVFIVNAQRRFLPQFEIVQNLVNEISDKYGMPITSMQSTHSDGQWRLPNEILTIKYHPLLGWGKVSHSGYHFIDMATNKEFVYVDWVNNSWSPNIISYNDKAVYIIILPQRINSYKNNYDVIYVSPNSFWSNEEYAILKKKNMNNN